MSSYIVCVCPEARRTNMNILMAMIMEDANPLTSNSFSQPLSADGNTPYTFRYCGFPVSGALQVTLQGMLDTLPTPAGGWPLMYGGNAILTESDASAARSGFYCNVNTGENAETLPQQNIATVLAALGLQKPPPLDV